MSHGFDEYAVFTNIKKYLTKTGYTIADNDVKGKESFGKYMLYSKWVSLKAVNDRKEVKYVFLLSKHGVITKSSDFNTILSNIKEKKVTALIISPKPLKTPIRKNLKKYGAKGIKVRNLTYMNFVCDPTENVYVPKHVVCSEEEKKAKLRDSRTSALCIPLISPNDPQVIWLDAKPGQLIKILRNDIIGPSVYYRIVSG